MSFGMIVLNGEPFVTYNLRAVYALAHEIIVVEGACETARAIATADGHSKDATLESLRRFQAEEDPEHKVTVVTAEAEGYPNGFWPEKLEMSQAYARRATGDYLWQLDYDEFYHVADMEEIVKLLSASPHVKSASVRTIPFWGSIHYITDGLYLRQGLRDCPRVFAWKQGYSYVNHRPVTVLDEGGRDLRSYQTIDAGELARLGIYMYHYSFVLPSQVEQKLAYHSELGRAQDERPSVDRRRRRWCENYFTLADPFYIDDTSIYSGPSWLKRFEGRHPEAIEDLWNDIAANRIEVVRRATGDIETLLAKRWYRLAGRTIEAFDQPLMLLWRVLSAVAEKLERARMQRVATQ